MIQGIQGYNNTQGANLGETNNKLESGNYICKILGVKATQNKSGSPMLVLQFDIAEGEFAGYYTELYNTQIKQNKDVKFKGIYYQNMTGNSNSSISTSNDGYTATRTSTGEATFMGMGSTAWTWLIIGIAAIAIVALVWYYSMQFTNKNNNNKYE